MSLLKWAIFGLLLLPLAELVVFIAVAVAIGFLPALALTALTSLAGVLVIRTAGHGALARTRSAFGNGVVTRVELDGPGVLTVIAGALLAIPGFITDVIGAVLLFPLTRRLLHAALRHAATSARQTAKPGVVDLSPDQWRRVPEQRIGHDDRDQGA